MQRLSLDEFRAASNAAWRRLSSRAARLTIARRLALAFGLVLALFAGTTVFAVLQMRSIETGMDQALSAHADIANRAREMRKSVDDLYIDVLLLGLSTHREDVAYYQGNADKARAAYGQARARLLAGTHGGQDLPGGARALAGLKDAEAVMGSVAQLVRQQADQAAGLPDGQALELNLSLVGQISANMKNEFDFWGQSVDAIVDASAALGRQRQERAQHTVALAQGVQTGAAAVALLVGVLAAWLIGRSVAVPISHAVRSAERIARGELAIDIPAGGRDETGALMAALARMQASLRRLVGEVRDTAGSIEIASGEVAAGNSDLSRRTEHTAARLQGTASAVTQLSGAVRQSADSARTAGALARDSATEAERGGQVVTQVVHNMREIAARSGSIAEIIGVIDSIAFQTNILALNAAVEAARAGEQGRGFAVVAGEVRGLAQRTAEAAKDVKQLISGSVESVRQGLQLVEDAGATIGHVVSSSQRVMAAVDEIAQAMAAQSAGIGEIGGAMGEVDRLTQQNAALVEQSAAAAISLSEQSRRLSRAVAVFRVVAADDRPQEVRLEAALNEGWPGADAGPA